MQLLQGLASYCKAETTFTFYYTILPLSRAFLSINNREMKSESGFSFAMASQPLEKKTLAMIMIPCPLFISTVFFQLRILNYQVHFAHRDLFLLLIV